MTLRKDDANKNVDSFTLSSGIEKYVNNNQKDNNINIMARMEVGSTV